VLRKNILSSSYVLCGLPYFYIALKWFQAVLNLINTLFFRLFSKRPKTIFMLRKSKLCHKGNRMKIADFDVTRKWFLGRFENYLHYFFLFLLNFLSKFLLKNLYKKNHFKTSLHSQWKIKIKEKKKNCENCNGYTIIDFNCMHARLIQKIIKNYYKYLFMFFFSWLSFDSKISDIFLEN
jgi:hypothetical protein